MSKPEKEIEKSTHTTDNSLLNSLRISLYRLRQGK